MKNSLKLVKGTGVAALVVVFTFLIASTLTVLSFYSIHTDYMLTQKAEESIKAYYAADQVAKKYLALIEAQLESIYLGEHMNYTKENITKALNRIEGIEITILDETDRIEIEYEIPVQENQFLKVVLETKEVLAAQERKCEIRKWAID